MATLLSALLVSKPLKVRSYPKFDTLEEERQYRKQHLAAAYRVFAERDLILVDEEGTVVIGDEPINAAAFAIHSEIHKARPDVDAACHAHSVYGKAWSVFGKELDMMTQDSLRFWKDHAVYTQFNGIVLDREEGRRIAECLGGGKAVILQNHGLITVGQTIDAAAFWFLSLDKTCQAQLLVEAASGGSGIKRTIIPEEEAKFSYQQAGTPEKGWLAFQPYYDDTLAKTKGSFLK
ncbi:hypothetical protein LTR86_004502 [Recurvomyces mirabilis]|nr:hypothetical protein LTR86_004502 [Recurvomyces mirabilis]